jgi:hypothetical protein
LNGAIINSCLTNKASTQDYGNNRRILKTKPIPAHPTPPQFKRLVHNTPKKATAMLRANLEHLWQARHQIQGNFNGATHQGQP